MKLLLISIVAFFLLPLGTLGQDQQIIDSLELRLPNTTGTERVDVHVALAGQYYRSDPGKTWSNASAAERLATELNYELGIGKALGMKGAYYLVTGDADSCGWFFEASLAKAKETQDEGLLASANNYMGLLMYYTAPTDSAMKYFQESLRYWELLGDATQANKVMNNIANIYDRQADYETALKYFMRVLENDERANNKYGIARVKANIGGVFLELGQFETAIGYQEEALAIQREINDLTGQANSLMNVGNTYTRMQQWADAGKAMQASAELWQQLENTVQLAAVENNLGGLYQEQELYPEALTHFERSLELKRGINDLEGLASTYGNLGMILLKLGSYAQAEERLLQSVALCDSLGTYNFLDQVYMNLAQAYIAQGKTELAMSATESALENKDRVFSEQLQSSVAELETAYQAEVKARENLALRAEVAEQDLSISRSQNQRNVLLASLGLLLLLGGLGFVLYRQQRDRQALRARMSQEKLRLNAVIAAQEDERKRIAGELHDGIGQLLSAVKLNISALGDDVPSGTTDTRYSNAIELIDESVREVRGISHTMMPNVLVKHGLVSALEELAKRLRVDDKFQVSIDGEALVARLPEQVEVHVYRILQEVVNNIIKHASASEVMIQLDQEADRVTVMIEDNGNGYNASELDAGTGNGWHNIKSRLELLKGSIEIDSQRGRKGTVVFVEIAA